MCGHDCRVNAVSPCHIGAGGLIVHFEEKRPVYKPPVQCATSSNPSIYIRYSSSDSHKMPVPRKRKKNWNYFFLTSLLKVSLLIIKINWALKRGNALGHAWLTGALGRVQTNFGSMQPSHSLKWGQPGSTFVSTALTNHIHANAHSWYKVSYCLPRHHRNIES